MATLVTFLADLKRLVPDTASKFADADKNAFILDAVTQYSKDRPLIRDAILAGDGTLQAFNVPSDWSEQFSTIQQFEFPIDEVPPIFLDLQDNIRIVRRTNVLKILTMTFTILATETARIIYTTEHLVNGTTSTVYGIDENAIINLSASKLCEGLATFYSEELDDTIDADIVDHRDRGRKFSELAEKYETKYEEHISSGKTRKGALVLHDQDTSLSWGRDLVQPQHRRRFR